MLYLFFSNNSNFNSIFKKRNPTLLYIIQCDSYSFNRLTYWHYNGFIWSKFLGFCLFSVKGVHFCPVVQENYAAEELSFCRFATRTRRFIDWLLFDDVLISGEDYLEVWQLLVKAPAWVLQAFLASYCTRKVIWWLFCSPIQFRIIFARSSSIWQYTLVRIHFPVVVAVSITVQKVQLSACLGTLLFRFIFYF